MKKLILKHTIGLFFILNLQILLNAIVEKSFIDFLFIYLFIIAIYHGSLAATIFGTIIGFVIDSYTHSYFGVNMFSYALLGALIGVFNVKKFYLSFKYLFFISLFSILTFIIVKPFLFFIYSKQPFIFSMFINMIIDNLSLHIVTFFLLLIIVGLMDLNKNDN